MRSFRVLLVWCVVALAACSAPARGTEPEIGPVPTVAPGAELRLPVEDYLVTDEQGVEIAAARVLLITACLRRFGVEYTVPLPVAQPFGPRSLTERRYGITDAGLAELHGYGMGPRDPALRPAPVKPELDATGQNALTGQGQSVLAGQAVPEGGCAGDADRVLDRDLPAGADPQLGQRLQFESFEAGRQDSRVRAAVAAWSACMAEAGHHYADPLAVAGDPAFIGDVTPTQLATAATDIDCKVRTNLVGVWFTVESAYQRARIEKDPDAFAKAKDANAARLRAARHVPR
ncbi:hypothetical protein ABZ816_30455 [Actinosynnema sp. NPDC047251]|uniref:Putative secreted protein n=1 Tax=Saccharothrix espanaensis (strain ATCC 51144 / DSM 44229 / JCM 9112 / NBRC 15066 / NRRL 15764) TaxID=1179773 RepID=K0K7U0_SACES|nr:hypothetical protein [Saccharothrix espanaensis]CCH32708.1 putative secreted protein [Saccharothrix espanaensis DSM 44229]